ncbi:MAG: PAS-domain containing protein [Chromatiaceae bacterium]|nr:PAS-domain containing protein [Chromatiaceae bacterium]MCP5435419.1 PAS-domain containing protein [Chromatiaceae bacterium]HPQ26101.1 PAS domain-containing hybrid sensor histidine kinase/response regulator [Gammaproteobacteria bacterium]
MISNEIILSCTVAYLALLFFVAYRGDRQPIGLISRYQPLIYTLSLTVYCTSWTFFGAVGAAAQAGVEFFSIYLGPILVFLVFHRFLQKLIDVSKRQKTTTIADFIATRYGKSTGVAALVSVIALIGTLPYISLQIKAIASAYDTVTAELPSASASAPFDTAFGLTLALAVFAILFGTRTIDATVHHRGMMHAISVESIVKLLAFLCIAGLAVVIIFELAMTPNAPDPLTLLGAPFAGRELSTSFFTKTLLAAGAIVCLPRQFHVMAVEARGNELPTARWGFPLYLLLFSLAVLPITTAGLQVSEGGGNADLFVLYLPLESGSDLLAILSYLGGFSAATGMVIVSTLALSTMVSNDLIFPLLVRYGGSEDGRGMHTTLLRIRRLTIFILMLLAYGYYQLAGGGKSLYSIGLLSFAAAIQFMPAVVGGLYWKRGHRHGVIAGLSIGFLMWCYTLLLPSFANVSWLPHTVLVEGVLSLSWLDPQALFGVAFDDTLTHGVFWSLSGNIAAYLFFSLRAKPSFTDRLQASAYVDQSEPTAALPAHQLRMIDVFELCARFAGEQRAVQFFLELGYDMPRHGSLSATAEILEKAQHLLAGSIGTATAEHLVHTALHSRDPGAEKLYRLLDTTGQALQFNRETLQVTLDNIGQAVSVVDSDLRLRAWNRRYVELFDYPSDFLHVGKPIEEVIRFNVDRGFGPDFSEAVEDNVVKRLDFLKHGQPYVYVRDWRNGKVIQTEGARLPDGGFITTFTDISALIEAERELAATNETLEAKVSERTEMLSRLNRQLEEATRSKSRFLAAASHDLTQPLSASKLYMAALLEDVAGEGKKEGLAKNALGALHTAESLLKALLDISKLDSGVMQPEISRFPIQRLFDALQNEFAVLAQQKGLILRIHKSHCGTESDPHLLRRILQNFLTNAIRYTHEGAILVICRHAGPDAVRIEVRDSGRGIPHDKLETIFEEFQQLERSSEGVGLGLAISQRLAALLNHRLEVRSRPGKGSTFSVTVPRLMVPESAAPIPVATSFKTRWLEGTRILCVDDDRSILDATRAVLERWGAQVDCVHDAAGFRAGVVSDRPYEIVLMDYQLHDRANGLMLLREYRAAALRPFLGVLVTAEPDSMVEKAALDAGFQFLAKPVEPAKLRSILHAAMQMQHVHNVAG